METANDNFNPSLRPSTFDSDPSFMGAFGVFFTAVTGERFWLRATAEDVVVLTSVNPKYLT